MPKRNETNARTVASNLRELADKIIRKLLEAVIIKK